MNKPTAKPSATRPAESSHTPAKSSSEKCSQTPKAKRGLEERAPRCKRTKTVTETTSISDASGSIVTKTANCAKYPQPCLHYKSIINSHSDYRKNPCPYKKRDSAPELQAKKDYRAQHPKHPGQVDWWSKIPSVPGAKDCEADEWPPAALYHMNDGYRDLQGHDSKREIEKPQFIRLMDGNQNGLAGSLWRGCPRIAINRDVDTSISETEDDNVIVEYHKVKAIYTRTTMEIKFAGFTPENDDGLQINICQPQQQGVDHRGFALLNRDPWFDINVAAQGLREGYLGNPNFKRWIDSDQIVAMEANSSTRITDEDLKKTFGVIRCAGEACEEELADLPSDAAMVYSPTPDLPVQAPVTSSTPSVGPALRSRNAQVTPRKGVTSADSPQRTQDT